MASEENVKNESCIYDPNFAVVCSFFENFSSLCGIQPPSFVELQQMLEDTQFIAPQLIDLHIRLMRKARKNVNPDRWQKTLARFCWIVQPDDCWILDQQGYEHLDYSQRLRLLLTLIGAQFDYNNKFKTDINKLDVKELRLQPVGRDKNGHSYWVHMDQETTLKVYKEDLDEEKWELIAQDREGLTKLIDELMKGKDPNRKLEEIVNSEPSSEEEEEEEDEKDEEKPPADVEMNEDTVGNEDVPERKEEDKDDNNTRSNSEEQELSKEKPSNIQSPCSVSTELGKDETLKSKLNEKLQQAFPQKSLNKSPLELISRPRSSNVSTPVKPLDKESFAQHLQKLDSINMLKPLLSNTEPGEEMNPAAIKSDLLKTKINQKFSIIKPGLQTDIVKSKLEPTVKPPKRGLKLEQILKSKLAQKLSGGSASERVNVSDEAETDKKETESAINQGVTEGEHEKSDDPQELPTKKSRKEETSIESEREIEEPVMVVTGVGNGQDCNSCNYEDEIEESIFFVYGVGSGSECYTGNNENDESANKNASHTSHLTHKVDNILKSVAVSDAAETTPSTSTTEATDTEKKKPKLWTIDAICNSDSSKDSKRDISQFPNFSFNKDSPKKENPMPYRSASESYSIFSLTENKDTRDTATVIPTNFYFGSNNQNPCFLTSELNPSFKSKSHSVENIVDGVNKKTESKVTKFNAESLYSKTNNVTVAESVKTNTAVVHSSGTAHQSKVSDNFSDDRTNSPDKTREIITPLEASFNKTSEEGNITPLSRFVNVPEPVSSQKVEKNIAPPLTFGTVPELADRSSLKTEKTVTTPSTFVTVHESTDRADRSSRNVEKPVSASTFVTVPGSAYQSSRKVAKTVTPESTLVTAREIPNSFSRKVEETVTPESTSISVPEPARSSTKVEKPITPASTFVTVPEPADRSSRKVKEAVTSESSSISVSEPADRSSTKVEKPVTPSSTSVSISEPADSSNPNVGGNVSPSPDSAKVPELVSENQSRIRKDPGIVSTAASAKLMSAATNDVSSSVVEKPKPAAVNEVSRIEKSESLIAKQSSRNKKLETVAEDSSNTGKTKTVVAGHSVVNTVTSEFEIVKKTEEPTATVIADVTKSSDAAPITKVDVSDVETKARTPVEASSTSSQEVEKKTESSFTPPDKVSVIDAKSEHSPPGDSVRDELNLPENKVTEDKTTAIEDTNEKSVPILEKPSPSSPEVTPKTDEVVERVPAELGKIDEKPKATTGVAVSKTMKKNKKDEKTKPIGRPTRSQPVSRQSSVESDTKIENENVEVKGKTDEEVLFARRELRSKHSKDSGKVAANETPNKEVRKEAKKGKRNDTDTNEAAEILPPARKETRKGKLKKDSDVPETDATEVHDAKPIETSSLPRKETRKGKLKKDSDVLETVANEVQDTKQNEASPLPRKETRKGKLKKDSDVLETVANEVHDTKPNEASPPARKETKKGKLKKDSDIPETVADDVHDTKPNQNSQLARKDTKKGKQRKYSDVPETPANEVADTEKNSELESEENAEPRRTTRSSRLKKSDVESGSEKVEKPISKQKSLKTAAKQKNENAEDVKTVSRATKSQISDNEVQQNVSQNVEEEAKSDPVVDKKKSTEKTESTEDADVEENDENSNNDATPKTTPKKGYIKKGKKKKKKGSLGRKIAKIPGPKEEIKDEKDHSQDEIVAKDETAAEGDSETPVKEADDSPKKEVTEPKKKRLKRGWLNELDVSNIAVAENTESPGIRQSRRIAQLKIKEQAENKYQETIPSVKKATPNQKSKTLTPSKKNKAGKGKSSKFKPQTEEESEDDAYYDLPSSKKKRKMKKDQPKKNFDPKKAWKSSESSSEEEDEEDHFDEEDEDLAVMDKSDHEFSPESDIDDDEDYQPVKRARTAHSKPRTEDKAERDDLTCQSCGTAEQPEWILLCDSCDEGWHAACLKPPVMAIPEGDWFCPPCQHNKLITGLKMFLKTYDKAVKKRASEESRRKRLEYVNISFANIIKEESEQKKQTKPRSRSLSSSDESSEESEENDEPLYQLRVRRQVNVRHRLNEYEELMNSAIERENGVIPIEPVVPEANVNGAIENEPAVVEEPKEGEKEKEESDESMEDEEAEKEDEEKPEEEEKKELPIILQLRNVRKKPARLTNLDVSSEDDHYSDEDFKGSSADDQEEDDEYAKSETDSDEASYRRGRGSRGPVRRSTRARRTRFDNDFINDDSDDDDEEYGRRKQSRKRVRYSESDSEEEDSTWGRRKKNKNSQSHRAKSSKKRRRIRFDGDSDEDKGKKKGNRNVRIKYGLDDDNEDYLPSRRTRGKKINYQDDLESESEEEEQSSRSRNTSRKIVSDDEEYINDEDEPNVSKEPSENGDATESGSESGESKKTKKTRALESDDSDSSPTKTSKTSEQIASDTPAQIPVESKADQVSEKSIVKAELSDGNIEKDQILPVQATQLPNEMAKNGTELPVQKIDQNPSLQGMQSMAQNLSQPLAPVQQFTPNMLPPEAAFPARIPMQQPLVPVNYELGVKYETPEGMHPASGDKYPHPIRVPSPKKMYAMPDMQSINRPHLPPFMTQQMQPPIVGPPGAPNTTLLPQSSRPMPPAIPIHRGSMPMPMQGPMPVRPPHLAPPPPNVNIAQCGPPPGSMIPPNTIPSTPDPSPPKRRPRGRGKKQLEMERLQREREAMEANRPTDEMIPLHMLKIPPAEANAVRPPMAPPFSTYQQIPFSQAPPPVQQQAGGISAPTVTSSKRVKITPTRMRMPTPPDKIVHLPRSSNSAGMYPAVRHPPVPVSSPSSTGQPTPQDGKPPPVTGAPSTPTLPVKSEAGVIRPESSEQYYHPPTPYPPSQGPRVYGPRPEYTFARKPAPPGMYPPTPSSTAPNVVVNRAGGFASAAGPPPVSSPNIKSDNSTIVTNAPVSVPQPYAAQYPHPQRLPTSAAPPVASKAGQSAPYMMTAPTTQPSRPPLGPPGPPVSTAPPGFPVHHIKPPQPSTGTPSYAGPYYPRPPYTSPSTQPPVSFAHTVATPNFPPNPTTVSRVTHPPSPGSSPNETNTLNSLPPTSQSSDYQYSPTPTSAPSSEPETSTPSRFEEESAPAEETSTGEFGGLVSYFSSQREDDLDA